MDYSLLIGVHQLEEDEIIEPSTRHPACMGKISKSMEIHYY